MSGKQIDLTKGQIHTDYIARVAHEVNRAYCQALGDDSQPAWEEGPAWMRDSACAGVDFHRDNPTASPGASHEAWMTHKILDGWRYGPTKDPEQKTHPCLVPFEQLPQEQQAKDYLFRAVVRALISESDAIDKHDLSVRANRCLAEMGIDRISGLQGLAIEDLLMRRYTGRKTALEIKLYAESKGIDMPSRYGRTLRGEPTQPTHRKVDSRAEPMAALREKGHTWRFIGDAFGVSGNRARQILVKRANDLKRR